MLEVSTYDGAPSDSVDLDNKIPVHLWSTQPHVNLNGSGPEGVGRHPKASVNPNMHATPIAYVAPPSTADSTVKGNIDDQWDSDLDYGPMAKQIAKSVRRAMARAAKRVYN